MADCKKIVVKKDGSLDGLLRSIAFIEASALRWKALPVMSIWDVSLMLLPPPCNDDDRYFLAECIVSAIEKWGMRIYSYPLSLTHPAMFEALILGEKIEAKIHINDFERFAVAGKITKGCVVIAITWRKYIEDHEERLISLENWRMKPMGIEVYEKDMNDWKNNSLFSNLRVKYEGDAISVLEQKVMDVYEELRSIRKVYQRGILDEKTGKIVGYGRVADIVKRLKDDMV